MIFDRLKRICGLVFMMLLGLSLICGTMISCSSDDDDDDDDTPVAVNTTAISITASKTQIEAAGTLTLTATLTPSDSTEAVNWEVTAGSDKVTLSATTGRQITVTGKNTTTENASVTVKATSGSLTASSTFTVKGKSASENESPEETPPENETPAEDENPPEETPPEEEKTPVTIWTGNAELEWGLGNNNGDVIPKEKFDGSATALKFYFTTAAEEGSLKIMSQKDWSDRIMASASGDGYLVTDGDDTNKMVKLSSGKTSGSIEIRYSSEVMAEFAQNGIKFHGDAATITKVELISSSQGSAPEVTAWTMVNDFNSSTIASGWETANWANGGMFGCGWKPDHISFNESNNGLMKIKLDNTSSHSLAYTGGELRTTSKYGYGYYEVKMKPCIKEGTNSSFFLYAETRDDSGNLTSWNEIDIEFLGKNTNQVQFNFYVDEHGEGHEYLLQDLGFDASQDFHVYGIEYAPDCIKWYVDGNLVYTANGCTKDGHHHSKGSLPNKNMQIMTNFWNGDNSASMKAWLGTFTYSTPLYAEYDYIKFKQAE